MDPDLGAVLTNADLIDADGVPIPGDLWSKCRFTKARQQALSGSRRYELLLGLPFSTGATMAFRSRFKPLLLPFPADAPSFIHDRWIAVLIAAVGRIEIIPEKLIAYRLHSQQQIGAGKLPLVLKAFIPYPVSSDAVALATLEERLIDEPSCTTNPAFDGALADRRRHVAVRSKYSRNPVRRLTQVASELRSGRYNAYPYGVLVSLQDLLVGTR